MRKPLFLAAIAAAAALPAAAAHAPGLSLVDPRGDAGSAPDIVGIDVFNNRFGLVDVRVTLPGRTPFDDNVFSVGIDADRDTTTGDDGAEYRLVSTRFAEEPRLERWNGTSWERIDSKTAQFDFSSSPDRTDASFLVDVSEIGGRRQFGLWARTTSRPSGDSDRAPDSGEASYAFVAPRVEDVRLKVKPSHAYRYLVPGDLLQITEATISFDDATEAEPSSWSCTAAIGSSMLHAARRCAWRIPRTALYRYVVVTVRATYGGRVYQKRVRFSVAR